MNPPSAKAETTAGDLASEDRRFRSPDVAASFTKAPADCLGRMPRGEVLGERKWMEEVGKWLIIEGDKDMKDRGKIFRFGLHKMS